MALTFYYGTMGSSKSAQALMNQFNHLEKGFQVALMKPAVDTRGGVHQVVSRIGLSAPCLSIPEALDLSCWYAQHRECQVIIIDEAQFLCPAQVEQLKDLSVLDLEVFCYGLKTDFRTKLFPGSQRLLELADHLFEIASVCSCGRKAEVNARIQNNQVVQEGELIQIGGNERYVSMCYHCWKNSKR